jgi:hypothetical protein
MKRIFAIFAIAIALATARSASAQSSYRPHVSAVSYTSSSYMYCAVNGVVYPVDSGLNVWAWNGNNWFIIGQLVLTGRGYIVVRNDGAMFAASCY